VGAPPPGPSPRPVNAGEAEFQGVELELVFQPVERLAIDASASILDFEYQSISAAALGSGISLNMESPFSPQRKYSAGVQYEIRLGAGGTLTPRVDWSYQSDMYTQAVNSTFNHIDGYGLANGRLTWRSADQAWDVSLEATNLTDKLYYLSYFDNRGSTQNVLGQPAPPRQWAVSIRRSF
jgi:iron complex outermembrane receptor protein